VANKVTRKRVQRPELKTGSDGDPFIDYSDVATAKHELGIAFSMYRAPTPQREAFAALRGTTKFTFERAWRVLVGVRSGVSLARAAAACGVSRSAVERWAERGAQETEPVGSPFRVWNDIYEVFAAAADVVLVAYLQNGATANAYVVNKGKPNERTVYPSMAEKLRADANAKWLLTHRPGTKDDFAGRSETDVTSKGEAIKGGVMMVPAPAASLEEWEAEAMQQQAELKKTASES
jgi:hypothetical protein